jgi:hypothetical protein
MARFFGEVGYGASVETPEGSGIWKEVITEVPYQGDVIRSVRNLQGAGVNEDISVTNSISVVADPFAIENFLNIKYVRWMGKLWTVTSVESRLPRLILSLGSVYNGPTPVQAP